MNKLGVNFQSRDFGLLLQPGDLDYQVISLRWEKIGGPRGAEILVKGAKQTVIWLINLLRCPVEVWQTLGGPCWWGYVHGVTLHLAGMDMAYSLDSLHNRVAVAYSYVAPGTNAVGQRKTTPWAGDAISVAAYGAKEFLSTQSGMLDESAIVRRDAILALDRLPMGIPSAISGWTGEYSATLYCKGWWDTLDWKYASITATAKVAITTQISALIASFGQFFTGTIVESSNATEQSQALDGDQTAQQAIDDLLTTTNLLATVTRSRKAVIYDIPDEAVCHWMIGEDGKLREGSRPLEEIRAPVGEWVRSTILPIETTTLLVNTPARQLVESVDWMPDSGVTPIFRGESGADSLVEIRR